MVSSQEVIERSIWSAINEVLINLDMSIDPNRYLPVTPENKKSADQAIKFLKRYIPVFSTGSSQSKGSKVTPRIVINARGFFPGSVGLPKFLRDKEVGVGYTTTEEPYNTLDQLVDIHLVANNQEDLRLLHQVLFWSIPQKGYIKPYTEDSLLVTGNIFIQLVNFFDNPDLDNGILEKVYQFNISDCILEEKITEEVITPIKDITLSLEELGYDLIQLTSDINTNKNNN